MHRKDDSFDPDIPFHRPSTPEPGSDGKSLAERVPPWITEFSRPELWQRLASEDQASFVLARFSDHTVEQIAAGLPRIAASERRAALSHLLRHWATSRLCTADIFAGFLEAKEVHSRLRKLRQLMLDADAAFRAIGDEGITLLSHALGEPDPVSKTYHLLKDYVDLTNRVVPMIDQALAHRPRSGTKPKNELVTSIASLADIYTYITGLEPTRTADPVSGRTSGAFVKFAQSCLQAYDPKVPERFDWSIRRALEQRKRGEVRTV